MTRALELVQRLVRARLRELDELELGELLALEAFAAALGVKGPTCERDVLAAVDELITWQRQGRI